MGPYEEFTPAVPRQPHFVGVRAGSWGASIVPRAAISLLSSLSQSSAFLSWSLGKHVTAHRPCKSQEPT